jgi:isopentenyl-diphosphate Delta-isomerase
VNEPSARIVSSENECLILVDRDDNETGYLSKAECHDGEGVLHRAFSVFLFNDDGELLLQQRAPGKRLWPMYWSNSCCSHPRQGEQTGEAASRRLQDELCTDSRLEFVYKFIYQAGFETLGAEHELCHVFLGRVNGDPVPNGNEIASVRYLSATDLEREFETTPEQFTPWFRLEWLRLNGEFRDTLQRYTGGQREDQLT